MVSQKMVVALMVFYITMATADPIDCPPTCRMYCEHGFKKDANGCDICECEPCSLMQCFMYCPYGFQKDANGCDICRCNPPPCPPVCAMYCENGFVKDSNGCAICQCA